MRITAARLFKEIPSLERKIEDGSLTLSNISQINQFCRQNEINDLGEKKKLLSQVENLSKKEAEKKLFEISGKEKPAKETQKRVSDNKSKLSLILSDETMAALNEVKGLLGKDVSSDELIQLMVKSLKEKIEKDKFKQVSKPQPARVLKGRAISAAVKRTVYNRDKKCVNCGSQHRLNFDHRIAYSLGGTSTADNIRLLCFQCNQRAWMTSSG